MKKIILFAMVLAIALGSCKKTNKSGSKSSNSQMAGFWTFKTDPNNTDNYWNCNALFNADGTFRMYTALSLNDTAAARAIADTANQVVTFGTYTVSGSEVKMSLTEFGAIGITCTGSVNSTFNKFDGTLEISSDPNSATPLWVLTKP
ncbi:MAG: hypothetical protein Q8918_19005 [Bacteroidota bacterium]|nr:hypothetical protein [Bacteroidota bacterium]